MTIIQKLKFYLKKILDIVGASRALSMGRDGENKMEKKSSVNSLSHFFISDVLILSSAVFSESFP